MTRGRAARAALALALALGLLASAPAARASAPGPRTAWVVGDSITWQAAPLLRSRLRQVVSGRITVDAVGGRNVNTLDDLVRSRLRTSGADDVMVLALGTNSSPSWSRRDYERAVDAIPSSTTVVLVTVHKTRAAAEPVVQRRMAAYSRWMRAIAATRSHVCVADWQPAARQQPRRMLSDGVHLTAAGERRWTRLVRDAALRCEARADRGAA